jgi:hypothetical protein
VPSGGLWYNTVTVHVQFVAKYKAPGALLIVAGLHLPPRPLDMLCDGEGRVVVAIVAVVLQAQDGADQAARLGDGTLAARGQPVLQVLPARPLLGQGIGRVVSNWAAAAAAAFAGGVCAVGEGARVDGAGNEVRGGDDEERDHEGGGEERGRHAGAGVHVRRHGGRGRGRGRRRGCVCVESQILAG